MQKRYTPQGQTFVVDLVADEVSGYVTASVNGSEVGRFSYEIIYGSDLPGQNDPTYELYSANVAPSYRRLGIGREMIRLGEEAFSFGCLRYPKMSNSRHENHLSSEGAALLQSCARDGIIDWDPF